MSSFPYVVGLGLSASGVATGLFLSYPLLYNQTFLRNGSQTKLDLVQRLDVWARGYNAGKLANAPAALVSGLSLLSTLLFRDRVTVSNSSINLYALAGGLSLAVIPFTILAIKPINDRLFAHLKAASEQANVSEAEVEGLFAKWTTLHNVRAALVTTSLLISAYTTFVL